MIRSHKLDGDKFGTLCRGIIGARPAWLSAEGNSSSNGWLHESFNRSKIAREPAQLDKWPLLPRMDHRHAVVKRAQDNYHPYKGGVAVWFTGRYWPDASPEHAATDAIKGFTRRNTGNCQRNCSFFHRFPLSSTLVDGFEIQRHQTKCKSLAALFLQAKRGSLPPLKPR